MVQNYGPLGPKAAQRCRVVPNYWVAVKELNLSYHNIDTHQIIMFLDYGSPEVCASTSTMRPSRMLSYVIPPEPSLDIGSQTVGI